VRYSKYIAVISGIGDFILLNLLFNFLFCYLRHFDSVCGQTNAVIFFFYINLAWIITVAVFHPYSTNRESSKKQLFYTYLKSVVFLLPLFLVFFQVFSFNYFPRHQIKYLFPIFFIALLVWRFALNFLLVLYRKAGYNYRNVVVIGNDETGNELKEFFLNNAWAGYKFKGFFTYHNSNKRDVVGTYDELEQFVFEHNINEIYIISGAVKEAIYKIIANIVGKYAVKIRIVPPLSSFYYKSVELTNFDTIPVLKIQEGPLSLWYNRLIKRAFDVGFSIFVIVLVLSWLIPLVGIINLLTGDKGNIFFTQHRTGHDNKPFRLIKFRTMLKNEEANIKQATKDDDRITIVGRILRKTSIDEIPQFINVLKGDMSVVGPRPHMLTHTAEYKEMVKRFMIRHSIKPGITGYSQVRGYRGEIKRTRDIKDRIKFDLYYIENWSFSLDMKIIAITILSLFKGDKAAY